MPFYLYVMTRTKLHPSTSEPNTTCDYSVKMNEMNTQVVLASDVLGCCFVFVITYHHLMLISIIGCVMVPSKFLNLKSREKHLNDSSNVTRICILPTFKLIHTEHLEYKKIVLSRAYTFQS